MQASRLDGPQTSCINPSKPLICEINLLMKPIIIEKHENSSSTLYASLRMKKHLKTAVETLYEALRRQAKAPKALLHNLYASLRIKDEALKHPKKH